MTHSTHALSSHPQRVTLISPAFHGYWQAIESALSRRGHTVTSFCYDALGTLSQRLHHKMRHELPDQVARSSQPGTVALEKAQSARAARVVQETRPDVVVVIKGDVLGQEFWDAVDASGARRVTWFYDEARRMHLQHTEMSRRGPIATYSSLDSQDFLAQGLHSTYLPLAFDTSLEVVPRPHPDISFIGARYGQREPSLRLLHEAGLPVKAYGRAWSHHIYDRVRTWSWQRPSLPAGRDLSRADAYAVMAGSPATLNLHGDQDGFTMRTFEACGVGGVQLIDRTDVGDLYEPGVEILPFTSAEELVELCERALVDHQWAEAIRAAGQRRTLAEHTFDHRVEVLEDLWNES